MRYRISFFQQSHSTLFLRDIWQDDSGLFDCLIFVGVVRVNLADVFDFERMTVSSFGDGVHKRYDFSCDFTNSVQALAAYSAKVRDFPEVPSVEVNGEWTLIEVSSWPI